MLSSSDNFYTWQIANHEGLLEVGLELSQVSLQNGVTQINEIPIGLHSCNESDRALFNEKTEHEADFFKIFGE